MRQVFLLIHRALLEKQTTMQAMWMNFKVSENSWPAHFSLVSYLPRLFVIIVPGGNSVDSLLISRLLRLLSVQLNL